MRTLIAISPESSLESFPNPTGPARMLVNFRPRNAAHESQGLARVMRAAGLSRSRGGLASLRGQGWTSEEVLDRVRMRLNQFEGSLSADEIRKSVLAQYRAPAAICRDLSDLSEIWELSLHSGQALQGLVGQALEQQMHCHLDPKRRKTPMLVGGAEQVFFKVKNPFGCAGSPDRGMPWLCNSSIRRKARCAAADAER